MPGEIRPAMEQPLEKVLDDAMNAHGVTGVVCADKNGLCLGVRGSVPSNSAGAIATLANQALMLEPESDASPIISLESDAGNILIRSKDGITTAIYKVPT